MCLSFRLRGFHPLRQAFPKPFPCNKRPVIAVLQPRPYSRFRLLRFRSPLLAESRAPCGAVDFFSRGTEMVQFPQFASVPYFIQIRTSESLLTGYPIRLSTDHRVFAPPRRFSQLAAAFLAAARQGIRRKPSSRLTILSFRRVPGTPRKHGLALSVRRFRSADPFNEHRLFQVVMIPPEIRGFGSNPHLLRKVYILEIRGFEPLTSSLQSWRSSQLSYIP